MNFLRWRLFWGDYWVIGLDDEYQWAVIGTPDRACGWILARTPTLKKVASHHVAEIAEPTDSSRTAAAARFRSIRLKISECSGYNAYQ